MARFQRRENALASMFFCDCRYGDCVSLTPGFFQRSGYFFLDLIKICGRVGAYRLRGVLSTIRHQELRARAARLNETAKRLATQAEVQAPFSLAFLTDAARISDPLIVARALPEGSGVILRDYDMPRREGLARRLQTVCAARGLHLLIGADEGLARRIGAAGVHWPRWRQPQALPGMITTAACHNEDELDRAADAGVSAAFLSPVFATASHPGAAALSIQRFQSLTAKARLPVLGLGGVTADNAALLGGKHVCGFGAIGALAP